MRAWSRPRARRLVRSCLPGPASTYPRRRAGERAGGHRGVAGRRTVDLGSPKRRALVAALALSGGRPVSVDGLVDLLWGDHPPDAVAGGLQVLISGLRRALEPDRAPRAPSSVLVTVAPGYALRIPADALDAARFDGTVSEVHRRLGARGPTWARPALGGDDLREVLHHSRPRTDALARGAVRRPGGRACRRRRAGPGSMSCAWWRWRTAPSRRSRWVTTARWPPTSRR